MADADCLTSRAGTALLVGLADRVELTGALSQAMGGVRRRRSRHDPGRTLRDLAVMLADGGDCLADLSALRDQPALFGDVVSDATAWRVLAALDGERIGAVRRARASARGRVWELAGAPERVLLDLDATLITAHSDKEQAAGNYKHGFGFHPLLCYEATTQEALAGILRPGNAGANTARPHRGARPRARAASRAGGQTGTVGARRLGRGDARLPRPRGRARLAFLGRLRPDRAGQTGDPRPAGESLAAGGHPGRRAARRRVGGRARARLGDKRLAARDARDLPPRAAAPPARNSPSATRTATASRSSSPTSRANGSPGSNSSTASTRSSRTGSAAAKTPASRTSPSAPSSRTPPGSSSSSPPRTCSPGRNGCCSPASSPAANQNGCATGSCTSPAGSPASCASTSHAAGPGATSSSRRSHAYARCHRRRRPPPVAPAHRIRSTTGLGLPQTPPRRAPRTLNQPESRRTLRPREPATRSTRRTRPPKTPSPGC